MSLTLLRAAERVATPWKNGGGVTRDVALSGSGPDDFAWRVSIAEIARLGPFSAYAGIDRLFVVLDGRLRLTIDGHARELGPENAPVAFPGEAAVSSDPLHGGAQALNVMTRRGAAHAALRRIVAGDIAPASGTMLVVAVGPGRVRCGHEPWRALARFDAARIDPPCALRVEGEAWLVSVTDPQAPSSPGSSG